MSFCWPEMLTSNTSNLFADPDVLRILRVWLYRHERNLNSGLCDLTNQRSEMLTDIFYGTIENGRPIGFKAGAKPRPVRVLSRSNEPLRVRH